MKPGVACSNHAGDATFLVHLRIVCIAPAPKDGVEVTHHVVTGPEGETIVRLCVFDALKTIGRAAVLASKQSEIEVIRLGGTARRTAAA
jgi:hypothetical protein